MSQYRGKKRNGWNQIGGCVLFKERKRAFYNRSQRRKGRVAGTRECRGGSFLNNERGAAGEGSALSREKKNNWNSTGS